MTTIRPVQSRIGMHGDPFGGRLLIAYLVSLLLHGLLLFGITGGWLRSAVPPETSPIYYVDLVQKPVLSPQAGRPEPKIAASVPSSIPKPTPATDLPRPVVKAASPSKKAPPAKSPEVAQEKHVREALQKLRDEQSLQQRLAALRQNQAVPIDTPAGLPDAQGTQAGVSSLVYVQATIQENWALSPYLLADAGKMARIEAWVRLTYSKSGHLERFSFERESADPQFNESIKRALVKSQQLPNSLPVRLEDVRVVFNLKALSEAQR